MKDYTIKVKFSTARAGRGKGAVIGSSGNGEIDIKVDGPFGTDNKEEPELIAYCTQVLQNNPDVKGTIISLEILEIIEKV